MRLRVLGMISGTSHDGIDLAVVEFDVVDGTLRAQLGEHRSVPYSARLRRDLVAALPPGRPGLAEVCALDTRIGQEFAAAAASVAQEFDVVCTHGQTVYHWVQDGAVHGTLQLGQPAWIAEATGVPVVSDLRTADVAAGGQGAPLVPLLDRLLLAPFVGRGRTAAALNLGGIANVTVCVPGLEPRAWDTGPANALIDAAVSSRGGAGFDRDGAIAASGRVDRELLDVLLAEDFYALAPPKSSGKELFHSGYVARFLTREIAHADLVATVTALTARTVADALRGVAGCVDVVVASGGGVRNPTLMAVLAAELGDVELVTSDVLGVPPDEKEAIAFALLGFATVHGLPGNVASCTGARGDRVLGRVTPGRRGFPTVPPLSSWPAVVEFTAPPVSPAG